MTGKNCNFFRGNDYTDDYAVDVCLGTVDVTDSKGLNNNQLSSTIYECSEDGLTVTQKVFNEME